MLMLRKRSQESGSTRQPGTDCSMVTVKQDTKHLKTEWDARVAKGRTENWVGDGDGRQAEDKFKSKSDLCIFTKRKGGGTGRK